MHVYQYHAIRKNYAINLAIQGVAALYFESKRSDWPSVSFVDH